MNTLELKIGDNVEEFDCHPSLTDEEDFTSYSIAHQTTLTLGGFVREYASWNYLPVLNKPEREVGSLKPDGMGFIIDWAPLKKEFASALLDHLKDREDRLRKK